MVDYVYVDGQRATPYMAWQLYRLKNDFRARFNLEIYAVSGIRLHQEQIDIFLQRYVTAGEVLGRYVYDTRVWRGVRYYRVSSAGTVAVPGESNHEIQGNSAAWDFADNGSDAGVSRAGSARSNWLRANAWRYDLEPEGFNFGEAWHYKTLNIFNAVPGGSNATPQQILEEADVTAVIVREDDPSKIVMIDGTGVTRPINERAIAMANYIGIKGNWNINKMSKEDFRQTIEMFGFRYDKVMSMSAGQRLLPGRAEEVVSAGVATWPGQWS